MLVRLQAISLALRALLLSVATLATPVTEPRNQRPLTVGNPADAIPPRQQPFVEPVALELPSDADLHTTVVSGRTFNITRIPRALRAPEGARPTEVTASADAALNEREPEKNIGTWGRNPVRGGTRDRWRHIVRFDVPQDLPQPQQVVLLLNIHDISGGDSEVPLLIQRTGDDWNELQVNWNNQPPGTGETVNAAVSKPGTLEIDLTDLMLPIDARQISLLISGDSSNNRQVTLQAREIKGGAARLQFKTQQQAQQQAAIDPLARRFYFENDDESLFFKGSGRGGMESRERLVVEDCTFVMDFQEGDFERWDARRSAIYVEGFNEVIVRRSRFISKGLDSDPVRKTNASLTVYDTQKVLIEDCYFEGKTNWMRGHITVFCSGPTTIRRVEVAGQQQGDKYVSGGGIWVGNGLGEGKAGTLHADTPELMIYPSGPLLVEDCLIRDQQGNFNTDGIYVQSIHPFLIRNTRVQNWGRDALVDVGFRDTAGRKFGDKHLANHGAIGVIENCHFENGMLKVSVGAGGGIVLRNSTLRNAWLMPYAFDGGNWYVINNRFEDLRSVIVSGYDGATKGWAPREGMFQRGGRMKLFGNVFASAPGHEMPAMYISGVVLPLIEAIDADYNVYLMQTPPKTFADCRVTRMQMTFAQWQAAGKDNRSEINPRHAAQRPAIPSGTMELPGGIKWSTDTIGLLDSAPRAPQ